MIRALTLPGAGEGFTFLFSPDFSKVGLPTITAALGQSFFSLSIGLGAMITYGSYLDGRQNVGSAAGWVVGLDTGVAVLAGLVVLPAVFAVGLDPAAGPGLAFVIFPKVFAAMPAGEVFGTMFFVMLGIAALTSSISLLEPIVAFCRDEYGLARGAVATIAAVAAFLLAIPCSWSLGVWSDVQVFGLAFLDLLDFVTTTVMLPLGGVLIALFVGWVIGDRALAEVGGEGCRLARAWLWILRIPAPAAIAWILLNGLIG